MPLRALNEPFSAATVLATLGTVMAANTYLQQANGAVLVNGIEPLLDSTASHPALILFEAVPSRGRIEVGMWQGRLTAEVRYEDEYTDDPESLDVIWARIDLDLRRMLANLEDNPNLIYPNPGGTRYLSDSPEITLSPFWDKQTDTTTYPYPVAVRIATVKLNLLPYRSAR